MRRSRRISVNRQDSLYRGAAVGMSATFRIESSTVKMELPPAAGGLVRWGNRGRRKAWALHERARARRITAAAVFIMSTFMCINRASECAGSKMA